MRYKSKTMLSVIIQHSFSRNMVMEFLLPEGLEASEIEVLADSS